MPPERAAGLVGQQLGDGVAGEVPADDGGAPQHLALARAQQLEAGGQQGLDGRWQLGLVLTPALLAQEAASCSRNRGFPAATSSSRSRTSGVMPASTFSSAPASSAGSGPSSSRIAAATRPPRPGAAPAARRARQSTSSPCLACPATASARSRKVGSAQCRSSSTTSSGRRRASVSSSRRVAQKISGGARFPAPPGRAPRPATRRPGPRPPRRRAAPPAPGGPGAPPPGRAARARARR